MDGPSHYREAERLLTPRIGQIDVGGGETVPGSLEQPGERDIALAQVHSLIALVAASIAPALDNATWGRTEQANDWREALR